MVRTMTSSLVAHSLVFGVYTNKQFRNETLAKSLKTKHLPIRLPRNNILGTPRPTIYKWLFQLDDEPNLYIENGCFTISIHL